jgi:hypothetical protein
VVSCAGYDYPESITVDVRCTGGLSKCEGAHEFRVVGCFTSPPSNPCPEGFTVAGVMLIGQWAEAAEISRRERDSVCMYAGGDALPRADCGFDRVNYPYCWRPGAKCCAACPTNCAAAFCNAGSVSEADSGYTAPVLCVR